MQFEEALNRLRPIKNQNSPTALRDAEKAARKFLSEEEFGPRDRGRMLSLLGEWVAEGCRYLESIELHQEGLGLVSSPSDRLSVLCGLAVTAEKVGDRPLWESTAHHLMEALDGEGATVPEAAWAYGKLARMLVKLGAVETAHPYAVKGVGLADHLGMANVEATNALGFVEEETGNLKGAAELYAAAADMSTGECRSDNLRDLIRVKAKMGHGAEAFRLMKEGVDELSGESQRSLEAWLDIFISVGDVDQGECFRYMKKIRAHIIRRREGR